MFIGHFAAGFAAKRLAPRASLGVLIAAALLPDLLWTLFFVAGWEEVRIAPGHTAFSPLAFPFYPISHSLATGLVWAAALALAYRMRAAGGAATIAIFSAVLSHWLLDALTHRPDMPLYPGGPMVGLGLWNSVGGTILVEGAMFAAGVVVYLKTTRPKDRVGTRAFWALVLFLIALYARHAMGQPPPNLRVFAAVGLATWLFPVWAWWLDRHRAPVGGLPRPPEN